jgi:Ni/Co efflux regulator RcnB
MKKAIMISAVAAALMTLAVSSASARSWGDRRGSHGRHAAHSAERHHHRHHRHGHRVRALPRDYVSLAIGGLHLFLHAGNWYRPAPDGYVVVEAPVGAVVRTLPPGYRVVRSGPRRYYVVNGAYHAWDPARAGYVVVQPPVQPVVVAASTPPPSVQQPSAVGIDVIAYPAQAQPVEQQARDRYECHLWSVDQSGLDPTAGAQSGSEVMRENYRRSISACLQARGYTVD